MEMNSTPLPKGKKFFPWPKELAHVDHIFESLMKKETIDLLKLARKTLVDSKVTAEYWNVRHQVDQWEVLSDEKYPVIKMPGWGLSRMYGDFGTITGSKKMQYGASTRIKGLDIPVPEGKIKVQYCPQRKGLIVHDCPYEGELVGNKPMVVNKKLKSLINEKVGEIELLTLLGVEDFIGIKDNPQYSNKNERGEIIANKLEKLIDGSYEDEDLAMVCGAMGKYEVRHNSGRYDHKTGTQGSKPVSGDWRYYLDTSRKLDGTGFDFTASVRTKMIYHFGGYTLPDNYEEWFNG